ncbi:hypothetical protein BV25DRAFT_1671338 [Artomyces pyxidatus]|uniref:Uncharacterized protein n=1 Tax=Artomyces pyxidatus TaxID=48021 RepID=A0ACB8SI50_9AGAM|nr:hypothetical protein BV25DRAFT_1671338 [Artomyces pyxidatus]
MASAPLAIPDDHVAYTRRATWIHVTALCARRARGDNLLGTRTATRRNEGIWGRSWGRDIGREDVQKEELPLGATLALYVVHIPRVPDIAAYHLTYPNPQSFFLVLVSWLSL